MRAVIQRVQAASVVVDGATVGGIGPGILVLLAVAHGDGKAQADQLADKIIHLRIFEDRNGKFNRSLLETGGQMLVVSQFTLLADCRKGRRPSFTDTAAPGPADELYRYFVETVRRQGIFTATGAFGAKMAVTLINDGPVTIVLDSPV
jgi:D-tyrosyl-tRNA(Tyr) deacylase